MVPLFLSHSLRSAAISLSSLFSSIFIYEALLFLTGQSNTALLGVFSFFLGLYVFKLVGVLLAEEMALRLGFRWTFFLGLILSALCISTLALSQRWPVLLCLVMAIWGLSAGFYWFGWHGMMAKCCRRGSFGEELGLSGVITTFLLAGVPLLGGWLISRFGYSALFAVSLFFIFLDLLSVRFLRGEQTHQDTSFGEALRLFRTHKRVALTYAGNSSGGVIYADAMPLYLFLILGTKLSLGEFLTASSLLVAFLGLAIGWWVDKKGKTGLLESGSLFSSSAWLGRLITRSVFPLFILDMITRIAAKMVEIPLGAWSYEKALDGHSTGRAILFRETAVCFGEIFACLLLIVSVLCGLGFEVGFLAAAIFSLAPLLLTL